MVTVLEGGYMRYVSAQSRHDSGECTYLDESGLCLSILVLSPGFDLCLFVISFVSFFYFSMLLLLFFRVIFLPLHVCFSFI